LNDADIRRRQPLIGMPVDDPFVQFSPDHVPAEQLSPTPGAQSAPGAKR
jgi:hypothetical protein